MSRAESLSGPETLNPYPLDAIVVLGAVIQKDISGKFIFTGLIDGLDEKTKALGARSRAIAVDQAFKENLAPLFLITGGRIVDGLGNETSKAELLADYIERRFHIPREKLLPIGTIGNTLGNVEDTVSYLSNNPDILKLKKIGVLSNRFHLPRALEMFSCNEFFSSSAIELFPLAAEDLMTRRFRNYPSWTRGLDFKDWMAKIQADEARGRIALMSGTYSPLRS